MTTTSKRTPPRQSPTADKIDGRDLGMLEGEQQRQKPSPVERRDWRGEGVVGNHHTD